jgi:predicted Ser/Thr protein kinase
MRCIPFLIGDVVYPIHTYLKIIWKARNPRDVNKISYDSNMNLRRVVMENAFGSLKNKWRILKHFNSKVDKHH